MKPSGREKPEPDKSSWLRYCSLHLFVLYCVGRLGPRPRPAFCHLQCSKVGGAMERGYTVAVLLHAYYKAMATFQG